jgi:hypothetical protein
MHAPSLFFLAQLVAARHDAKVANAKAATVGVTRIERPENFKNLQAAMSLANDDRIYTQFCVSSLFLLAKCY